jgi:hypothetical protein
MSGDETAKRGERDGHRVEHRDRPGVHRRVFNQHSPELAAKCLAPGMTWHGQTLGTIEGVDNVTGMLRGFIGALPDQEPHDPGHPS